MIDSVTTSLELLKFIAAHPDLGLSELSRLSAINKSRTFRMLSSLCESGYVHQNADSTYRLGHQALIIGQAARQQIDLLSVAESEIEKLAVKFDENLQIRVRDGNEMMQIFSRRSHQKLQVHSTVGNCRELGDGASGKLLLALLPVQDMTLLSMKQKKRYEELESVRQKLIASSYAELTTDIGALAVPIFDCNTVCVACLSVSVPMSRLTEAYEIQLAEALKETGHNISVFLGAHIN